MRNVLYFKKLDSKDIGSQNERSRLPVAPSLEPHLGPVGSCLREGQLTPHGHEPSIWHATQWQERKGASLSLSVFLEFPIAALNQKRPKQRLHPSLPPALLGPPSPDTRRAKSPGHRIRQAEPRRQRRTETRHGPNPASATHGSVHEVRADWFWFQLKLTSTKTKRIARF